MAEICPDIPLVASVAGALYKEHNLDFIYAFDRKEAKAHGEGGTIVGPELAGKKVFLVDDVITSGKAIRHTIDLLNVQRVDQITGVMVALDRAEKALVTADNDKPESAIQSLEREYPHMHVLSIVTLNDLILFVQEQLQEVCESDSAQKDLWAGRLASIVEYRRQYGV
ncbi:hypothetical protein H696_02240 [Fonticula alba]|uniref:orotate phosphoribosyltransferase n=1 Tax=Fonticula alba TaxID=691883 RepID=A0A058ZAC8_FONAL|nr:hypothetical protein H696_02240 [Fonticula alba]KCV71294.1 hypothetical protein H696_02240 [Fonticula alba]|eukprot:XP_009494417.1 hypothetical protein H696_02240 [Fonticula alba]